MSTSRDSAERYPRICTSSTGRAGMPSITSRCRTISGARSRQATGRWSSFRAGEDGVTCP